MPKPSRYWWSRSSSSRSAALVLECSSTTRPAGHATLSLGTTTHCKQDRHGGCHPLLQPPLDILLQTDDTACTLQSDCRMRYTTHPGDLCIHHPAQCVVRSDNHRQRVGVCQSLKSKKQKIKLMSTAASRSIPQNEQGFSLPEGVTRVPQVHLRPRRHNHQRYA